MKPTCMKKLPLSFCVSLVLLIALRRNCKFFALFYCIWAEKPTTLAIKYKMPYMSSSSEEVLNTNDINWGWILEYCLTNMTVLTSKYFTKYGVRKWRTWHKKHVVWHEQNPPPGLNFGTRWTETWARWWRQSCDDGGCFQLQ